MQRSSTRREISASEGELDTDPSMMRDLVQLIGNVTENPDSLFGGELDDRIVAAIDELPDDYREVLVLSDLGDLTYPEIEQVLGIRRGTVKRPSGTGGQARTNLDVSACQRIESIIQRL